MYTLLTEFDYINEEISNSIKQSCKNLECNKSKIG